MQKSRLWPLRTKVSITSMNSRSQWQWEGQKIQKNSHLLLKLLSKVNTSVGDFFQILVAFSEYLNFTHPTFTSKSNEKIKALKTEAWITSMDSGSQLRRSQNLKKTFFEITKWIFFFKFLWPSQNTWSLPARPSRAKAMQKSRLWRLKFQLPQWILVQSWGHKIRKT